MTNRLNCPKCLVSYYKLNGQYNDSTGRGGLATNTGAWGTNQLGKSVISNPTSTALTIPHHTGYVVGTGDMTVSLWYNRIAGEMDFLDKQNSVAEQMIIAQGGTNLTWSIGGTGSTFTGVTPVGKDTMLTLSRISGNVTCYIDGVIFGTEAQTNTGSFISTLDWVSARTGTSRWFTGKMWDFRFYNVGLTQNEVLELYKRGTPNSIKVNRLNASGPLETDLLFNTSDGIKELVSGTNLTSNNVILGKGMIFNGTNGIVAGTLSSAFPVNTFTISAWINPTGWGEGGFGRVTEDSGAQYDFIVDGSERVRFRSGGLNGGSGDVKLNKWQNVAITCSVDSKVNFYVNGVLSGVANQYMNPGVTGTTFYVGNRVGGDRTFQGTITDVRAYNTVKTASWIKNYYEKTAPESDLVFSTNDGMKENSIYDKAMTLSTNTVIPGKGITFTGNDSLSISTTGMSATTGTIVMGVTPTTIDSTARYIFYHNNSGNRIYIIQSGTTGNVYTVLGSSGSAVVTTTPLKVNKTSQIVLVWNNGTGYVYVDGVLAGQGGYVDLVSLTTSAVIGFTSSTGFIGKVNSIRIYNTAKSTNWVKQDYEKARVFY